MPLLRREFHTELASVEDSILASGHRAAAMLGEAVAALRACSLERVERVRRSDDALDETAREVQERILLLMARQAPVASELRLVTGLLSVTRHVGRIGDYAVNVARAAGDAQPLEAEPLLLEEVLDMGGRAIALVDRALDAFGRRDLDGASDLENLDDPLDRQAEGLFGRLVRVAGADGSRYTEWAVRMVLVTRYLERVGDHAVGLGDQLRFVLTGALA